MQRHMWARSVVKTCATVFVLVGALASSALAQPGQPSVAFRSDLSVVVSYVPLSPVPAGGAFVDATFNDAPIPGTPFAIGQATTVASAPLPFGNYTVRIVWAGGAASPPYSFTLGALGAPTIRVAAADLDTVVPPRRAGAGALAIATGPDRAAPPSHRSGACGR